jgi:hypothetical protein
MIEKRINVLLAIQNEMPKKYVEKKFKEYKEEYNQLSIRTVFDKIDNMELVYEYNNYMKGG